MKIHIVTGTHPVVPGTHQSAHIDRAAAQKTAMELLGVVAASLDEPITPPADTSVWEDFQRGVQTARIMEMGGDNTDVDDDDLSAQAGFRIEIVELDAPNPRIVVEMDGGLIETVSADADVDLIVVDYDVEGADEDRIVEIPSDVGMSKDAYVSTFGRQEGDSSAWIERVSALRNRFDADQADTESAD